VNKGDIVLIPFPFTNLSGTKNRPALILHVGNYDVTVAFITSKTNWMEDFDVKTQPSALNGIKIESLIRLSKIATLDRELIIGKLGHLDTYDLIAVNHALIKLFQLE
jgi:mRNA interferase MazF